MMSYWREDYEIEPHVRLVYRRGEVQTWKEGMTQHLDPGACGVTFNAFLVMYGGGTFSRMERVYRRTCIPR